MEEKNKKLRLLVTTDCPNHCPLCCNNRFDFDKLPVVDRWDYDEIMITGGEPMLFPAHLHNILRTIRETQKVMGIPRSKIYVYTANINILCSAVTMNALDGIVYTPHSEKELIRFLGINARITDFDVDYKSLRLNLFPDIKKLLEDKRIAGYKGTYLSYWQVKDIKWVKDCPVPEGEDFRRIAKLWEM